MGFWDRLSKEDLSSKHEELESEVATLSSFRHLTDEEERRLKDLKKTKLLIKEAIGRKRNGEKGITNAI